MQRNLLLSALIVGAFFVSTPSTAQFINRQVPCDIKTLAEQGEALVAEIPVEHSQRILSYRQTILPNTQPESRSDFETRSIPLALVNVATCDITTTTITRRIQNGNVPMAVTSDDGIFFITLEPRAYGSVWNGFNTPFRVVEPAGWVVVAIHWKTLKGMSVLYRPESEDLLHAFPWVPTTGEEYFDLKESQALQLLEGVPSRGIPGETIKRLHQTYLPRFLKSLAALEHATAYQHTEYLAGRAKLNPLQRTFTVLGINLEKGFNATVSRVGARGMMQIMPKTCAITRNAYRKAPIPVGCFDEHDGHVIEIATAALIVDDMLHTLRQKLSNKGESPREFASRPEIRRLLRASYNYGPGRVAGAKKHRNDWVKALPAETRGYLEKGDSFDGVTAP